MTESKWELANEFDGGKAYVDAITLVINGDLVRARIRVVAESPAFDKRNQQPIREVVFDKEFNLEKKQARCHSVTFTYTNGVVAEPLQMIPEWVVADMGTLIELNYIRSLTEPTKKRWWLF